MATSNLSALSPSARARAVSGAVIEATVTEPAPLSISGDLYALADGRVEGPLAGWHPHGITYPVVGDLVWFTRSTRGRLVCITWETT